jgi:hypothetical protein
VATNIIFHSTTRTIFSLIFEYVTTSKSLLVLKFMTASIANNATFLYWVPVSVARIRILARISGGSCGKCLSMRYRLLVAECKGVSEFQYSTEVDVVSLRLARSSAHQATYFDPIIHTWELQYVFTSTGPQDIETTVLPLPVWIYAPFSMPLYIPPVTVALYLHVSVLSLFPLWHWASLTALFFPHAYSGGS